jgi:hypothetical protein
MKKLKIPKEFYLLMMFLAVIALMIIVKVVIVK